MKPDSESDFHQRIARVIKTLQMADLAHASFRWIALVFTACCWTVAASAADNTSVYHVGETSRVFHPAAARNWRGAQTEALVTTIWYPVNTNAPELPHDIGAPGDPIFHGHPAADNAPLSTTHDRYPLLVLSHGTGGSARDLDWLAASFAANGYIVASTNHPGNNATEPLTREGFLLWWERATDVNNMLDALLADPALGPHIDPDRIVAAGFSLGGYTVLELAGARTNLKAFGDFCRSSAADAICRPPEAARLKSKDTADSLDAAPSGEMADSMARAGASYRDERIKAVFAMAPALGEAFDSASFADVRIPVMLTAGTSDTTVPVETNVHRVAGLMPTAQIAMVPGASHYTFLNVCLPRAATRLARICADQPGVDREEVHAETAQRAMEFFRAKLGGEAF